VVVGVPHEKFMGERIKAFVVLKDGMSATAEEIIEYCRQELSKFKVPGEVEFRRQLPKTPIGKMLRRVLRDEERNRLGIEEKI
jgi:long-chain acyl-CoA synthetase